MKVIEYSFVGVLFAALLLLFWFLFVGLFCFFSYKTSIKTSSKTNKQSYHPPNPQPKMQKTQPQLSVQSGVLSGLLQDFRLFQKKALHVHGKLLWSTMLTSAVWRQVWHNASLLQIWKLLKFRSFGCKIARCVLQPLKCMQLSQTLTFSNV